MGKKSWIYPSEQGGEDLVVMSYFCCDDLKLAVGHPGKLMKGRGWVESLSSQRRDELTKEKVMGD